MVGEGEAREKGSRGIFQPAMTDKFFREKRNCEVAGSRNIAVNSAHGKLYRDSFRLIMLFREVKRRFFLYIVW